ncbi:MAG: pitrilysin family protein [Erysipelotrichaceae bacterium]
MIEQLNEGVSLQVVETTKYKELFIKICFLDEVAKIKTSRRSLIGIILCDRCAKYPTKKDMNYALDNLYGLGLSSQSIGLGYSQMIELRSKMIDVNYCDNPKQSFIEWMEFLKTIIFEPLFDEVTLKEAKTVLKAKIERSNDDPNQFAINEALTIAGEGYPLSINSLGELKEIDNISLEDIKDEYKLMIENNNVKILCCGNFNDEQLKLLKDILNFKQRNTKLKSYYKINNELSTKPLVIEKELSQSNIVVCWQTNINRKDEGYFALRLGDGLFGSNPSSLLFSEVREKHSLCYSIYSNLISYDGVLLVTTGVESKNIDKTIELVKQQMERMKVGDFSDELLETAKKLQINILMNIQDNQNSLLGRALHDEICERKLSINEEIESIKNISREDIIKAFEGLKLLNTYVLKGVNDGTL